MSGAVKKVLAAAVLAAALAAPAMAGDAIPPANLALAKEMVALSGTLSSFDGAVMGEMVARQIKRSMPSIDDAALDELRRIAKEEFTAGGPAIADAIAVMYASHFSEADLKAMVAFYKTDTGKHLAAETPKLASESSQLATAVSAKIMQRFIAYMQERTAKDAPKP